MSRKLLCLLIIAMSFLVISCGPGSESSTVIVDPDDGGDSGGETPDPDPTPGPTTVEGYFVDSEVAGLTYSASPSGVTGVTDANGKYDYVEGDTVTFSIAGIVLGSCEGTEYVTPGTLFPDNTEAALNVAQFLQSIDSDGDPSNGITPEEANLTPLRNVNFQAPDFETFLSTNLPAGLIFRNRTDAMRHMDETIAQLDANFDGRPHSLPRVFAGISLETGQELWSTTNGADLNFIKDLDDGATLASSPRYYTEFGDYVLFSASSSLYGREIWITDGTEAGTRMLKDINEGSDSSYPMNFYSAGSVAYFQATTAAEGNELWKTDGTEAGTVMVKNIAEDDIDSGIYGSYPQNFYEFNGKVYFSANTQDNGSELWVTDGTEAGTNMVTDLTGDTGSSSPSNFVTYNGELYFVAEDSYDRIMKTDGTEAGTEVYKDTTSYYVKLATVGSYLIYNDSNFVYSYDGSSETELQNLNSIESYTPADSVLYFTASSYDRLWVTDGTIGGTSELKESDSTSLRYVSGLTLAGNSLFFKAETADRSGTELYVTDGTGAGTKLVKDIYPGNTSSFLNYITAMGDNVYFKANDEENSNQLWKSDGTEAGTEIVKLINSEESADVEEITAIGDTLYFSANDGKYDEELWVSDGTEAGTVMLADANSYPKSSLYPYTPIIQAGDKYFFVPEEHDDEQLWVTDATAEGTFPVEETAVNISAYAVFDGKFAFIDDHVLKITDGTQDAVVTLEETRRVNSDQIAAAGDYLYYAAEKDVDGDDCIYRNSGTPGSSVILTDSGDQEMCDVDSLIAVGDKIYFTADYSDPGTTDRRLYVSDGTPEGTIVMLTAETEDQADSFRYFTAAGDTLFFQYYTEETGQELWKSDGTEAGTEIVKNIAEDTVDTVNQSNPRELISVGNTLYFTADDNIHGRELWKSDGTEEGTVMVLENTEGEDGSYIYPIAVVDNKLYLVDAGSDLKSRGIAVSEIKLMVVYNDMDMIQQVDLGGETDTRNFFVLGASEDYPVRASEYFLILMTTEDGVFLKKVIGSTTKTLQQLDIILMSSGPA